MAQANSTVSQVISFKQASLARKHNTLEKSIHELRKHPSADSLELQPLKKKRLLVRDQLAGHIPPTSNRQQH